MMQLGEINKPISGFQAKRQILTLFLKSQRWELPFNWDFGRDPDAIDPVEQILSSIEKYLTFTVESVEIEGSRIIISLDGKKFDVSI
jgi:hypothetical protein